MIEPTPPAEAGKPKKSTSTYPEVFGSLQPPKSLWKARRIGDNEVVIGARKFKGVLHLAGRGCKTAEIVFLSPSVFREEEMTQWSSDPAMLKGPAGNLFLRLLYRCGFVESDWFYTALCKYNVPKLKPTSQDIRWNAAILDDELKTIKPKIIVCCGKIPFDHLFKIKFKLQEIQGGFFRSETYDCLLYPMDTLLTPLMKPEFQERMMTDLKEVRKCLDEIRGHGVPKLATDYSTIDTAEKVQNLMTMFDDEIKGGRLHRVAPDCEWHGQTAWGGQLRSIQMAWKPGHAAFIRFCAPVKKQVTYVMDQPLPVIREIMKPVMNNPKLKFVGHNIHADMAWMDQHLEIDVFGRTDFDTLFAQHTLNEYADLKLERFAVKYTDAGRYDLDLMMWKKANKADTEDGYGLIPDNIIIPYGCRDVDATLRVYPILAKKLIQEKLWTYYNDLVLPFVTDGFYELMSTGIPVDREYLDEMRETYAHHGGVLMDEFRGAVQREANMFLHAWLRKQAVARGDSLQAGTDAFLQMLAYQKQKDFQSARSLFQSFTKDSGEFSKYLSLYNHWAECPAFNTSSVDHVRRWLFDVKRFRPLKTTKKDGIQMAWDRVITLPPDKQLQYTPSADKQSLKVFATKDKLVAQLEELKSVQNITKAFLKAADTEFDEETGKTVVVQENGLHSWIQEDGRIHTNLSLTETARPRTWQPNILNFPKAITKPLESAFTRINIIAVKAESAKLGSVTTDKHVKALQTLANGNAKEKDRSEALTALLDQGYTQPAIDTYTRLISKPVSIRSSAKAPDGCAFLDMDLKTAEVVALGNLSGDTNLQKVLTEPDRQFARTDKDDPKKAKRICYNENVNIPVENQDVSVLVSLDDPKLLRDSAGNLMHPLRDVHWEMAEEVAGKPRELLEERLFRDGVGKVGNFSIPYGAAATLLERMVEANTGIKPPEGTGQKMIDTHAARYPTATEFQLSLERTIEDPGYYRSISGRVRHFFYNNLGDVNGLSEYTLDGLLSGIKRQARNFPMQELVASTTAKALLRFIKEARGSGMQSRIMMVLYDAMTGIIPFEELKWAKEIMQNCLTIWTPWTAHGKTFHFDVDASIGFRWGVKATKEEKELLAKYL